jgi:hypothetical protein
MNETTKIAAVDTIPPDIMELLGPPPLLNGEEAKLYYGMLTSFARSIRPGDLITWLLIKDLADHRLEIHRYRRMKVALMAAAHKQRIYRDWDVRRRRRLWIAMLRDEQKEAELADQTNKSEEEVWVRKCEINEDFAECVAELRDQRLHVLPELLSKATTTEADVVNVFADCVDQLKQIDGLIQAAERRFSNSLAEIDHHLRGLGRYCREELDKVIDGEVVEPRAGEATPSTQVGALSKDAVAKIVASPRLGVRQPNPPRRESNLPRRSARRNSKEPARQRLAG